MESYVNVFNDVVLSISSEVRAVDPSGDGIVSRTNDAVTFGNHPAFREAHSFSLAVMQVSANSIFVALEDESGVPLQDTRKQFNISGPANARSAFEGAVKYFCLIVGLDANPKTIMGRVNDTQPSFLYP